MTQQSCLQVMQACSSLLDAQHALGCSERVHIHSGSELIWKFGQQHTCMSCRLAAASCMCSMRSAADGTFTILPGCRGSCPRVRCGPLGRSDVWGCSWDSGWGAGSGGVWWGMCSASLMGTAQREHLICHTLAMAAKLAYSLPLIVPPTALQSLAWCGAQSFPPFKALLQPEKLSAKTSGSVLYLILAVLGLPDLWKRGLTCYPAIEWD